MARMTMTGAEAKKEQEVPQAEVARLRRIQIDQRGESSG